jgi:hypothetical protein
MYGKKGMLRLYISGTYRLHDLRGPLARMKWYRVVTDESQFIRNRFVVRGCGYYSLTRVSQGYSVE